MIKKTLTILLILASLTLVVSGCLKKPVAQPTNQNQSININQNTNTATSTADEAVAIPEELKETTIGLLKIKYPEWFGKSNIIVGTVSYWRRGNGYLMALSNAYDIEANIDSRGSDGQVLNSDQPLQSIKQFFIEQGFVINKNNSDSGLIYSPFYDYYSIGFERGSEKCNLAWTNKLSELYYYYFIDCAEYKDIDEKYYQEFSLLFSNPNTHWYVEKREDNFAMGRSDSSWWIAEKVEGEWVEVLNGQDYVLCDDLSKHKIPSSLYDKECWDTKFNSMRLWEDK